jgi:2-phosphosulfolactate phosphatase
VTAQVVEVQLRPDPERVAGRSPATDREWSGVAVDVLRATSTLTAARRAGAGRIVPCLSVEEALALRATDPTVLACGERGGRIVPGFDLGNSPFEYTPERVGGRTLAFASTNGSRALRSLAHHDSLWLGAFVSASALVAALAEAPRVRIVCAGEPGGESLEDTACAGWLAARLVDLGFRPEGAGVARALAAAPAGDAGVRHAVESAPHARVLAALGERYARDVEWCAHLDALPAAAALARTEDSA